LPYPLGPTRTTNSPWAIVKLRSRQATTGSLRPALAPLTPEEAQRFLAEFSRRVSLACPPQVIGGESVEMLDQFRVFVVGQSPV
jgi:trans-aconitate methyltransferase